MGFEARVGVRVRVRVTVTVRARVRVRVRGSTVGCRQDPTVHGVGRREGTRGVLAEGHARLDLLRGGTPVQGEAQTCE